MKLLLKQTGLERSVFKGFLVYLLGHFHSFKGASDIRALAIDTDGIDGSENNAGAIISPCCWKRAREAGLLIEKSLDNNDAYSFFKALDDLI